MKKDDKGYTLVEMIIVIAVIGILSATAIPKFVGISKEARIASLQAAQRTVKSADTMIKGKAIIEGISSKKSGSVYVGDNEVSTKYGHVELNADNLMKTAEFDGYIVDDILGGILGQNHKSVVITQDKQFDSGESNWRRKNQCFVEITQNKKTGELTYSNSTDGC